MRIRQLIVFVALSLAGVLGLSGYATAKPECPEGYVGFVNTETYQTECLPADVGKKLSPEAAAQTKAEEAEPQNTETAPKAEVQAVQVVPDTPQESSASQIQMAPRVQQVQAVYEEPEDYETEAYEPSIHDDMTSSGFYMQLGFGYAAALNLDIKALLGYHFGLDAKHASLGLYLDLDARPGFIPTFTMDLTLDPTLHITGDTFRFSIGLGLGIFYFDLMDSFSWFADSEDFEKNDSFVRFEIKPMLAFDWFLSSNTLFGFGFSVPLIFVLKDDQDLAAWFNLDFHIGYKF